MKTKTTPLIGIESELLDRATDGIDMASDRAHKAVDRFADAATSATRQFGKKTRKFASSGDHWIKTSRDCVQ